MASDDDHRGGGLNRARQERLAALVGIRRGLTEVEAAELQEVFSAVYNAHVRLVLNVFRKRGIDDAMAKDLAQDAFLELRDEIIEKGFPDDMQAYVSKIAHGKLLNHVRREHRSPFSIGLPSSDEAPPPRTPREMERDVDLKAFRERLAEELSAEHLEVAELCLLSGLKIREAAEILGIPEGTVSSRLRRVKEVIARLTRRWLPPSQRQ